MWRDIAESGGRGGSPSAVPRHWGIPGLTAMKSGCPRFGRGTAVLLFFAALALSPAAGPRAGEGLAQLLDRYAEIDAEIDRLLLEVEGGPTVPPASPAPGHYGRLLSTRKNAAVTVGGEFRAVYAGVFSQTILSGGARDPMVSAPPAAARTGDLSLARSMIVVDAEIGDRWRASIGVNLDGRAGPHTVRERVNPNRPGAAVSNDYPWATGRDYDNVGEVYLEYLKSGHSGFGFKVGRFRLPFGLAAGRGLFAQSYLDAPDLTGSYLMHPLAWENSPRLPHASKFLDPAFAAMVTYEMRDIVRFQAALFEDEGARTGEGRGRRGGEFAGSRPLRSFMFGAALLPLEGWELSLAFRNRFDRGRGVEYWSNSPYRGDFRMGLASGRRDPRWDAALGQWSDAGTGERFGARRNEQAFVVGLAAEIPHTRLSASFEYAHGWNQGFNRHVYSDDVNIGLAYRLLPRLTIHGQWEWLRVRDRSWLAGDAASGWARDTRSNALYRVFAGAEYELGEGLSLEGGWQRESWRLRSRDGGGPSAARTLTATMVYVGTRFVF